jgi:hypothetical protein
MTAERNPMRRAFSGGMLALGLALAGCGPDWQPSFDVSSRPRPVGESLTISRVTGQEAEFAPLRSEDPQQLRLSAGLLQGSRPQTPEAALLSVPEYRPVLRPGIDTPATPPTPPARSEAPPAPPRGSSTPPALLAAPPPAERQREPQARPQRPPAPPPSSAGRVVTVPGEPSGVVTSGGRVQSYTQPGNPAGGIAIQDGGNTTIIQPGGRVTTVPTPR